MQLMVRQVTRAVGLNETARRLGCSRGHLSMVVHGKRQAGKALAAKLRRLGVCVAERPNVKG